MKTLMLLFAASALVSLCLADDCSAVQKCLGTDYIDIVNRKVQSQDFPAVCMAYKNAFDCLNNADVGNCHIQVLAAQTQLKNMTHSMCGPDGKLTGCGLDVYHCTQDLMNAMNDAQNRNNSAACTVLLKFSACADNIKQNKECDPYMIQLVNDADSTISNLALKQGCHGPCGQAIGNCTSALAADISGLSISKTNYSDFCRNSFKTKTCLDNLKTPQSPCGLNNAIQMIDAEITSIDLYLKDYCDESGNPSACVRGLDLCNDDVSAITDQTPLSQQCRAAANFLECVSNLPCQQELAGTVQNMRTLFMNGETTNNCPTLGSCNQRIESCKGAETQLKLINNDMKNAQFCKIVATAISCYDFVRRDPICQRENMLVTDFENKMTVDIAPLCGPEIGDCNFRIMTCDHFEKVMLGANITNDKTTFCKDMNQGVTCFDSVRSNPNCTQDKVEVTTWETKIRSIVGSVCNAAPLVHLSLMVMMVSLLTSVSKLCPWL